MDVSPEKSFYAVVRNFYNRNVERFKNMKIAHKANPSNVLHTADRFDRDTAPTATPEEDVHSIPSEVGAWGEVKSWLSGFHDGWVAHCKSF